MAVDFTHIYIHLVRKVFLLLSPLKPSVLVLPMDVALVRSNLVVKVMHHGFVEVLLLVHISFMSLQGLSPSGVLDRIIVLDDSIVFMGHNIATIVQGLHLVCPSRRVPRKSIVAQIDMPFHLRAQNRIGSYSATTLETTAGCLVKTSLCVTRAHNALTLRNQVVF